MVGQNGKSDVFNIEDGSTIGIYTGAICRRTMEHLATVVHVLTIIFVFLIIYLACMETWVLFTWHPVLFAIGWVFLMTEGILMMSGDNLFSMFLTHKNRVLSHWVIQIGAGALSLAGFIIVIVNKNNLGKTHFHSLHGIFGLVAMVLMGLTFIVGLPALFNIQLRNYIPPKINKLVHVICGILTYIFGFITLFLSLYTGWFTRKANYTEQVVAFFILVVILLFTLVRPLLNSTKRITSFFR